MITRMQSATFVGLGKETVPISGAVVGINRRNSAASLRPIHSSAFLIVSPIQRTMLVKKSLNHPPFSARTVSRGKRQLYSVDLSVSLMLSSSCSGVTGFGGSAAVSDETAINSAAAIFVTRAVL